MTASHAKRLPPSGLQVILGDSAAGTFQHAFHPSDQLVVERDVLSCGPTPRCDDIAAWCEARRKFWNGVVAPGVPKPVAADFAFISERARFQAADQITIWTATGASEQLFVSHVVHRADEMGIDSGRLRLLQFETVQGNAERVIGTGELDEVEMHAHPQAVPFSAAMLRGYRDAWTAITSPDPEILQSFAPTHPDASPWLRQAIQLLLHRFPDKQSGLPWWDLKLLAEAHAHGPRAARVIGYTISHNWDQGDPVGDSFLFARLLRLGDKSLPSPLLEISGNHRNMRETDVVLTSFGLDVLEGRVSTYPRNPIEDWAAGVYLSSAAGSIWFSDDGKLVRP